MSTQIELPRYCRGKIPFIYPLREIPLFRRDPSRLGHPKDIGDKITCERLEPNNICQLSGVQCWIFEILESRINNDTLTYEVQPSVDEDDDNLSIFPEPHGTHYP